MCGRFRLGSRSVTIAVFFRLFELGPFFFLLRFRLLRVGAIGLRPLLHPLAHLFHTFWIHAGAARAATERAWAATKRSGTAKSASSTATRPAETAFGPAAFGPTSRRTVAITLFTVAFFRRRALGFCRV